MNSASAEKYVDVCFDIRTVRAIKANRIPISVLVKYQELENDGKPLEAAIHIVTHCVENENDLNYVLSLDTEEFVQFMNEWMLASAG